MPWLCYMFLRKDSDGDVSEIVAEVRKLVSEVVSERKGRAVIAQPIGSVTLEKVRNMPIDTFTPFRSTTASIRQQ